MPHDQFSSTDSGVDFKQFKFCLIWTYLFLEVKQCGLCCHQSYPPLILFNLLKGFSSKVHLFSFLRLIWQDHYSKQPKNKRKKKFEVSVWILVYKFHDVVGKNTNWFYGKFFEILNESIIIAKQRWILAKLSSVIGMIRVKEIKEVKWKFKTGVVGCQ